MLQINNQSKNSGSIMIAALIVTLITGSLVGLFLKTITQEVENSYRFRMGFQAVNLAEAGLDYAIDAMAKDTWNSTNWTKGSNGYLGKNFPYVSYSWRGEQRDVWVYIEPDREIDTDGDGVPDSPVPAAVAEGVIRLRNGVEVRRQVYIELARGVTGAGFWGNGILGKNTVILGGQKQSVDSFNSYPIDFEDPDSTLSTTTFATLRSDYADPTKFPTIKDVYEDQVYRDPEYWTWSGANETSRLGHRFARPYGSVASISPEIEDITVGNADIYGYMATKHPDGASFNMKKVVGANGSLYDDQPVMAGSPNDSIDKGNITFDFDEDLPSLEAPTLTSPNTDPIPSNAPTTLSTGEYEIDSIDNLSDVITVTGDVTLVVKDFITIGTSGRIDIAPGAKLKIYVEGDFVARGESLVNNGAPRNLLVINTTSEAEIAAGAARPNIDFNGQAAMSAAIYAPEAVINLNGGGKAGDGDYYGSMVGYDIKFNGNNYRFHYDESLAYLNDEDLIKSNPEVTNWVELTAQGDRYDISTILTDGL